MKYNVKCYHSRSCKPELTTVHFVESKRDVEALLRQVVGDMQCSISNAQGNAITINRGGSIVTAAYHNTDNILKFITENLKHPFIGSEFRKLNIDDTHEYV